MRLLGAWVACVLTWLHLRSVCNMSCYIPYSKSNTSDYIVIPSENVTFSIGGERLLQISKHSLLQSYKLSMLVYKKVIVSFIIVWKLSCNSISTTYKSFKFGIKLWDVVSIYSCAYNKLFSTYIIFLLCYNINFCYNNNKSNLYVIRNIQRDVPIYTMYYQIVLLFRRHIFFFTLGTLEYLLKRNN